MSCPLWRKRRSLGKGVDKEVFVDQADDVLDDGTGGNGALDVAIVMQEAVMEHVFEGFAL